MRRRAGLRASCITPNSSPGPGGREMNFALIMFLLLVFTGAVWLLDYFVLQRRRAAGAPEPWWVEYPKSFFPVILIVFLLRSFLVEPFKIPSGSMLPTLLVGDFILVNKFTYGIRLPVINVKLADINQPQRGEVMVFRYPENPSLDYIKRVVGLPGDKIEYRNKRLRINGEAVPVTPDGRIQLCRDRAELCRDAALHRRSLAGTSTRSWCVPEAPSVQPGGVRSFPSGIIVPTMTQASPARCRRGIIS